MALAWIPFQLCPHPEAGKQICGFQNIGFRVQGLGYPLVLKPSSKKKSISLRFASLGKFASYGFGPWVETGQ